MALREYQICITNDAQFRIYTQNERGFSSEKKKIRKHNLIANSNIFRVFYGLGYAIALVFV